MNDFDRRILDALSAAPAMESLPEPPKPKPLPPAAAWLDGLPAALLVAGIALMMF